MVSSTGHGHASLKRVHYASGKFAVANIVTACQVRNPEKCSTRFLHVYLQHYKDQLIVPRMQGTANVSLSQRELAQVPVYLPPLEQQLRIADLIDTLDAVIDAKESLAASAMTLWWQAAAQMASGVADDQFVALKEIADIGGGITKSRKDQEATGLVEVPYLRVANVYRGYLDLSDVATIRTTSQKALRLTLLPGDVLMNEANANPLELGRGTVWRGEIENCIHQNHVFRVRLTDPRFTPEFLSVWANTFGQSWFAANGTQVGVASISKSTLSKFPVPLISESDQSRWSELLDSLFQVRIRAIEGADSLRTVRAEVLSTLLSGAHRMPETYDELMGV